MAALIGTGSSDVLLELLKLRNREDVQMFVVGMKALLSANVPLKQLSVWDAGFDDVISEQVLLVSFALYPEGCHLLRRLLRVL